MIESTSSSTSTCHPAQPLRATAGANAQQLLLGLDTFGDITRSTDGTLLHPAQVIRNVVAEGVLADSLGVDTFTVGEHHREDFAISSPEIILGAIAAQTNRMLLGTGVTVLSSDDPVRVYERFATLDAVSNGRAEVILGRGSFIESFPLFGFDLHDYEELFQEKLELFAELRKEQPVTWSGKHRASLTNQRVFPTTEHAGGLPAWIGVGGSPESVIRAVEHRLPMVLAIIGGDPARFKPFANLYRQAQEKLAISPMPLAMHSPGHIAETDALAREQLWPHYEANRNSIGAERGWPRSSRAEFEHECDEGALFVGSLETVAQKIAHTVRTLGIDRFDLKYATGTMPHSQMMESIGRYASEVIPRVRQLLA